MSNQSNLLTVRPTKTYVYRLDGCAFVNSISYNITNKKERNALIAKAEATGEPIVLIPNCLAHESANLLKPIMSDESEFVLIAIKTSLAIKNSIDELSAVGTSDLYAVLISHVIKSTFEVRCCPGTSLYSTMIGIGEWDHKCVRYTPEVPESL